MNKEEFTLKSIELSDHRVFRDAVHNYISVKHQVILDLINTPEMQRLRRIKQLGGTSQVYQSAEHSRFAHSLGVYHIVTKMIHDSVIGDHLSDYDQLVVMCAGLLHDIGHGPFSHCFENVFYLSHEEYTIKIILEDTHITKILNQCVEGLAQDVSDVIAKKYHNHILIQMISSQLDCDRMDYLLRDSYFTGTTYGQFDLSRILRVIMVNDGKIVYKKSGVQAIEDYILARYHMYWQVYYHPTARSYEQLLISIFKRVKDLYHSGYDLGDIEYLIPFLNGCVSAKDYIMLDESVVFYYFKKFIQCDDAILSDLSKRFLNRRLFVYDDLKSEAQKDKIIQKLIKQGYDLNYYLLSDDQSQIPYLHYGNNEDIGEIEILVDQSLVALPEASEIVGAITKTNNNKKDHKIFYPE